MHVLIAHPDHLEYSILIHGKDLCLRKVAFLRCAKGAPGRNIPVLEMWVWPLQFSPLLL